MIKSKMRKALEELVVRLRTADVTWAVTGSLAHHLHGIPIDIHDIDVLTDKHGAYEIASLFARELVRHVKFRQAEYVRSHFGELNLHGVAVQIIGDMETRRPDGSWEGPVEIADHILSVEFEGMAVPLMSLEHEIGLYERLGRPERAALLREHITREDA
jgi:hypothetical protein